MLGREVFMSVGPRRAWIKAPDSGVAMPVQNWGALNQLVNGAVGGTVSRYGAKTYSLSWSFLKADEYRKIAGLFSEAGSDRVFYLDPFAKDNILSKLARTQLSVPATPPTATSRTLLAPGTTVIAVLSAV